MATNHLHRLIAIIPAARQTAFNNWITSNLDPSGGNWFTVGLSASGSAPATHYWCSVALTNAQGKTLLDRIYAVASMTPPNWNNLTRAQIRSQLSIDKDALLSAIGSRLLHSNNDGNWDSPDDLLTEAGLQRVTS